MSISLWVFASPILLIAGLIPWALWYRRGFPSAREKEAGTYANHFVHVNEDRSVRELTRDERDFLNMKFYPSDGSRPYIKNSYGQTTPDGKVSGFLLRKRLPRSLPIAER